MKYLLMAVLAIFSTTALAVSIDDIPKPVKMVEVTDVITIKTTAFTDDETIPAITGYIVGLEGPPMGDYKVKVTNGNGFKGERFTVMTCTLVPYLEEVYEGAQSAMVLSTAFTHNGEIYNALGFYSGSTAIPSENYQVVVKNGKDRTLWNSMNCRIK